MSVSIDKVMEPAYRTAGSLGPMSLGKEIKRLREERGMSQDELAQRVGVRQPTIAALESGKSRGTKHISKFARALGVTVDALEMMDGMKAEISTGKHKRNLSIPKIEQSLREKPLNSVRVVGSVQAGAWKDAVEWDLTDQYELPVALPEPYQHIQVFGLEVHGASMDKVYKHGSVLLVAKYLDLGHQPANGEHVIVQRTRKGGIEASVKTFRRGQNGTGVLWPESHHPDFQQPLKLENPDPGEEIVITHKVIGSINFEP